VQLTPIEDGALVAMDCWDGWVGWNASQVGNDSPNDPPPSPLMTLRKSWMPRLVVGITSGVSITSRRSPTHTATPTRSRVTTININTQYRVNRQTPTISYHCLPAPPPPSPLPLLLRRMGGGAARGRDVRGGAAGKWGRDHTLSSTSF
jgi:hypothetical protein